MNAKEIESRIRKALDDPWGNGVANDVVASVVRVAFEIRNSALEEAAKVAEEKIDRYHDDGSTIADRIRALKTADGKGE